MSPTEVFLSHASPDRPMAQRLATVLTRHGVPVFFSPQNILGAPRSQ
ncbi:MAG: TIR domain-containing protein [Candidatus Binatia bacterium]